MHVISEFGHSYTLSLYDIVPIAIRVASKLRAEGLTGRKEAGLTTCTLSEFKAKVETSFTHN